MKKTIIAILTLALIITAFTIPASAAIKGDVDEDEIVTAEDARLVLRAAVGLDYVDILAADADIDGYITSEDARIILRVSVGLEEFKVMPYVAVTKGGIKLYEITSKEAQAIYNKHKFKFVKNYEGVTPDGKVLIFAQGEEWVGRDIDGASYDEFGAIVKCPYCNKTKGIGNNMCNGCAVSFY